jgi:DNA-binding PadR family transcriptional regulator
MYANRHDRGERRHARESFGFGSDRFAGHHRGGGRGIRRGRVFDHGDLRYVLLHLIADKPRHGYELIKAIEERFGGTYSPSPGVIYPTLTLLEELGYLRPETAEGPRKRFSITEEGTAFLAANQAVVEAIFGRMAEISRTVGDGPAPEIRRAMRNLEMALSIRLGKGPLGAEEVQAITHALDRAAAEIERS